MLVALVNADMAIAIVEGSANCNGAAISGEGDAETRLVVCCFSIDVLAKLTPVALLVAPVDADMS